MSCPVVFNEAEHSYMLNGVAVPGVSKIIEQAYDFRFVDAKAMERSRDLGKKVHKTVELAETGRLNEAKLHEKLAKYLAQWRLAKKFLRIRPRLHETLLWSVDYQYCGTGDIIGDLLDEAGAVEVDALIDIKTGCIEPAHSLQTMGYTIAGREMKVLTPQSKRLSIYLEEDSFEAKWHTNDADLMGFMGLRKFAYWEEHYGKRKPAARR